MAQNTIKNTGAIEAIFQRREQLQYRRAKKLTRIEALHAEIDQLDIDIQAVDLVVDREIGRGSYNNFVYNAPGFGKVTKKNERLYRVWLSIWRAFHGVSATSKLLATRGINQSVLLMAAKRSVPNLRDTTFRHYLHRLKTTEQLLFKKGGLWYLTELALSKQLTDASVLENVS